MSSRAISLIVAIPVLFLFYGFDINSKIQQSDERIHQLWTTLEGHYQQRNKQLSIVLQKLDVMQSPLIKVQDVVAAREKLLAIPTEPNRSYQQAVSAPFIDAQNQLDSALNALFVEVRKASAAKQGLLLSAIVQLEQDQQALEKWYADYAKEADDYNLMVSKFPGSVFADLKVYQLKPRFNMHNNAERGIPSANRVDFNNLIAPHAQ